MSAGLAVTDGRVTRRSSKANHRPDLQGMRAVAVLAVFVNHLFDWPSGGFVGVDVFFVLSGFFITGLLISERTTTRTVSFQNFYIRRIKRILPSALLIMAVTVIGSYMLMPAARAKSTFVDALYAAVFASNFRFEAVGADYFQQDQPPSPLQHYWSLSIEEQFYFVWPALLVAIFALTRGLRRKGRHTAGQWGLLGVMTAIVLASFAWAMYLSAEDPNRAYFSSLTRVWELGVGALLAIAGPWLTNLPASIRPAMAYAGLTGIAASLFLIDAEMQFPAPWAALPVLSTALVVASFHGAEVRGMSPLTNPVARWFGDTSYTLYLWHWPVIMLLLAVIPEGPLFYTLAVALSLGLTAITYHFYEDPIRKSRWLLEQPANPGRTSIRRIPTLNRAAWSAIGGVAAAGIVVGIAASHYNDRMAAARDQIAVANEREGSPLVQNGADKPTSPIAADRRAGGRKSEVDAAQGTASPENCFGAAATRNRACSLRNPGVPLMPSDPSKDHATYKFGDCWTGSGREAADLRSCKLGYTGPDAIRIAFTGDSHSAQLLAGLVPVLEANKWQLTTFLVSGCILVDPPRDGCNAMTKEITDRILAESPFDLLLVSASRSRQKPDNFLGAWAPLIAAGNRIAVIVDNPRMSEDAMRCLARGGERVGECSTPRNMAFAEDDSAVIAAERVDGATVIDLTDYYCRDDTCTGVVGDVVVYLDFHHVTATFAETLADPLERGITVALSKPKPS